MKIMKDVSVLTQTIKTPDTLEDDQVETRECQYQYDDGTNYMFMDSLSFETVTVPETLNENLKYYLKEGEVYPIVIWKENPIDVKVPQKMIFTVAQSENYIRGDTVSGATKPIVTETGLTVRVPLFIKQDEKILVNTETNEYVERVNE
jgi:elongation factor P